MPTVAVLAKIREEDFPRNQLDAIAMWIRKTIRKNLSVPKLLKIRLEDINISMENSDNKNCPVCFVIFTDFPKIKSIGNNGELRKKKVEESLRALIPGKLNMSISWEDE